MSISPARELALKVLRQVEIKGAYANYLLEHEFEGGSLSKQDQRLAFLLVYGVLRHRNCLDWIISQYSAYPLEKLTSWIRNDLRIGVYQLLKMSGMNPGTAVNESVNLAHKYGHKGTISFVNALLRKIASKGHPHLPGFGEDPERYLIITESHPGWLVKRWLSRYGPEITSKICQINNTPPPLTVRLNALKLEGGMDWRSGLEGVVQSGEIPEGLFIQGPRPIKDQLPYKKGIIDIETFSSMLIIHLLGVKPGERILDVCSGSGGKACHMADLMENSGEILCIDKERNKLRALKGRAARLGVRICNTVCGASDKEPLWKEAIFDRVIVDAPCSSLGVIRRHPEIRWLKTQEDILILSKIQKKIITMAANAVKKGGILLYCTCSFEPEETELVMSDFLENNPGFRLVNLKENLPESLRGLVDNDGVVRIMPYSYELDGFFAFSVTK